MGILEQSRLPNYNSNWKLFLVVDNRFFERQASGCYKKKLACAPKFQVLYLG